MNRGATLVFSDSNRRKYVSVPHDGEHQSDARTSGDIPPSLPTYQLFRHGQASDRRSLSTPGSRVTSPPTQGGGLHLNTAPYAAFDRRLDTTWLASSPEASDRWLKLVFQRPRSMPTHAFTRTPISSVVRLKWRSRSTVPRSVTSPFERGRTSIPLARRSVKTWPTGRDVVLGSGLGGSTRSTSQVCDPRGAAAPDAVGDHDGRARPLATPISIVLQRVTADRPYQAGARSRAHKQATRSTMSTRRTWHGTASHDSPATNLGIDGWSSIRPTTPDDHIDRLVGMPEDGDSCRRVASRNPDSPCFIRLRRHSATGWIGNYIRNQFAWIFYPGAPSVQGPTLSASGRSDRLTLPDAVACSGLARVPTSGASRERARNPAKGDHDNEVAPR